MRFPIKIEPYFVPVFFPFGATASQSWVDVSDTSFRVSFGWLMNRDFDRSLIADVSLSNWSWLGGFGLRTNMVDTVGVLGSPHGIVKVNFREPTEVRVLIKIPCRHLYLSLEDAPGFAEAIRPR